MRLARRLVVWTVPWLMVGAVVASAMPTSSQPRREVERFLSPLTPEVVAHLGEVAARVPGRNDDVFAKVGDSATVNRGFMRCFASDAEMELGPHRDLADTVRFFRGGNAGGRDPYRRQSVAAKVGWSAHDVLRGRPSYLLREVRGTSPRFALVMFGTNDIVMRNPKVYADRLRAIVDALTARGVIPVLYTVIPRNGKPEADALAPTYGHIVRAVARSRKVPWIDLHAAMVDLPDRGLMSDGVHPSTLVKEDELRGCDFTTEGLAYGQNVRNLLTMRMLDRLRRTVLDGAGAPDQPAPALDGQGTAAHPWVVEGLPFSHMATTEGGDRRIARYGCDRDKDESGPERVYRLRVERPTRVRLAVLHDHRRDLDLQVLGPRVSGDDCVARADASLVRTLSPGVHHVVVDTFVPDGGEGAPGEYVLLVEPVPEGTEPL
jgi:hypothetical protein